MKIFHYFAKEVASMLAIVTFVLLLIFLSNQIIRYLNYAAAGKLAVNALVHIILLQIPYLLALLLPLGLFFGVILTYGRLYVENEMTVLNACGMSQAQLIKYTMIIAGFVSVVVAILMLWVNPLIASQKEQVMSLSSAQDNILETLLPGRFQDSNDGQRVYYVEKMSRDHKKLHNVFIAQKVASNTSAPDSWTIVSAEGGHQMDNKKTHDRFIVTTDGYRFQGVPGERNFMRIKYSQYGVRVGNNAKQNERAELEAVPTSKLWHVGRRNLDYAAALQWRWAMPISVLLFALLAVPLSYVGPRQGRYLQLIPAILIYVVYANMLFVGRNWIEQGWIPVALGMWWIHAVVLIIALWLIFRRSGGLRRLKKS